MNFHIEKYKKEHKTQLLSVWEKSVLATHHFLRSEDFLRIKEELENFDFTQIHVYCLTENSEVKGFIGLDESKIEMLFLKPEYTGLGFGRKLIAFAISELGACLVDVNEQNENARLFYEKMGFTTFERTEKDDSGRNYPLLRMKLKEK